MATKAVDLGELNPPSVLGVWGVASGGGDGDVDGAPTSRFGMSGKRGPTRSS